MVTLCIQDFHVGDKKSRGDSSLQSLNCLYLLEMKVFTKVYLKLIPTSGSLLVKNSLKPSARQSRLLLFFGCYALDCDAQGLQNFKMLLCSIPPLLFLK